VPDHVTAERIVAERVTFALDARESTLTSRLRELRLVYTDNYPLVRQAADEVRLLEQRKAELLRQSGKANLLN
jgi:hypothetical protein